MNAEQAVKYLGLAPHPEGGWYRETFRDSAGTDGRAHSTAIYYLLRAGEVSRWHRIDAAEVWHWYAGDALELCISQDGATRRIVLGPDFAGGQQPQAVVPAQHWQSARPLGAYTLAGCTVAPGFAFSAFEIAPDGWAPG
jgi:predicted cupin superfamily sugar epimerase